MAPLLKEPGEFPPLRPPRPFSRGLVQLYTGEGKGKTSAALGVVLRAVGHDLKVFIYYFMKGDVRYGEANALRKLGVDFARYGLPEFVNPLHVKEEEKAEARRGLEIVRVAMMSDSYDLIVMDEVNVAVAWGLLSAEDVLQLIKEKPEKVELILTGRYADPKLIEAADYVTEMRKIKHPFDKGILARQGIDY